MIGAKVARPPHLQHPLPVIRVSTALLCATVLAGCARKPADATPEGAVRELTERLAALDGADGDAKAVFELLSDEARSNLQARADRYSNASGRKIAPWAMIVPSRSRLGFVPQSFEARIVGKYALVDVLGVGANQVAKIPCVFEGDHWRVDLAFPELPPLPTRVGGAPP